VLHPPVALLTHLMVMLELISSIQALVFKMQTLGWRATLNGDPTIVVAWQRFDPMMDQDDSGSWVSNRLNCSFVCNDGLFCSITHRIQS
jgi:hypothetical protein